jgi:hypothetical protein
MMAENDYSINADSIVPKLNNLESIHVVVSGYLSVTPLKFAIMG